jgi:SAM-dependent methyltransferase
MALRRTVMGWVVSQFGNPRGLGGHMAGWVMGRRRSNVERNQWVVSLLDVGPTDRILEVGFGPGVALAELARRAHDGYICGVDRSEVMVGQAKRRSRAAVRAGVLDVRIGSAEHLPDFDQPFDRVVAVNSIGFWREPVARLEELRKRLRRGGLIAVASQPRCPGATAATSAASAAEIIDQLEAAGFGDLRVEQLDLDPPVVCVLGSA